ncbi:MAG: HprK-related kinase A [Gammaproteobacteria bacterium]|nr:HprK-related kinase A [Gammaproteobacteria bacterium]
MRLNQLETAAIANRMHRDGLCLSVGPFLVTVSGGVKGLPELLRQMYGETTVVATPDESLVDFHIRMGPGRGLRRWWRAQAVFDTDATPPFTPFPRDHAFALFEWGLNWCIAMQAHQYLMFHSAVLERNGKAVLLPAEPGSGKSTLCAALMLNGWRLLSDEFGLYRPESGLIHALPRPIPLKNESIEIIRKYSNKAVLGPVFEKTRKGDVAHLQPSKKSLLGSDQPARPAYVVFPRYIAGVEVLLHPFAKGRAFLKLSSNAFNYRLQGARGFDAVADLVDRCDTYYLEFSSLDEAVERLQRLFDEDEQDGVGGAATGQA